MNPFQQQDCCQFCPDKRRVQHAGDNAKRIAFRLQEMMESKGRLKHNRSIRESIFHIPVTCSFSGSTCNKFSRYEHDLRQEERNLENILSAFLEELQGLDEKTAQARKGRAFELLRGHYPQAAFLMRK